jgi:glycosyltransferase involved in cell wall biosynthesis
MRTAKLSIVMPAYNVARYIGSAIRSVLDQTFQEFELIVVNDGSTDETEAIARSFPDERIHLINQPNRGVAGALNVGLKAARADYIARFDADDICYPHRFAKQFHFMTAHQDYVITGSAADYIDESGSYVFTNNPEAYSDEAIRAVRLSHCPFIHSSVMYKKEPVMQLGGYNLFAHSFEDHFLWQAILQKGKALNFPEPLLRVRLNSGSITIDERWRPRQFHQIKNKALETNHITEKEGEQLLQIIRFQDKPRIKESAYYSLLAKKYLWNNYQPAKARANLEKVIAQNKMHWKSYFFYVLSFLPQQVLRNGYIFLKKPPLSFITQLSKK